MKPRTGLMALALVVLATLITGPLWTLGLSQCPDRGIGMERDEAEALFPSPFMSSVSSRSSPDGMFPGTYYFYDDMKPGSPSDPNGDGDPGDSDYTHSGAFQYKVQSSNGQYVGYWYASSTMSSYSGEFTSPVIDLSAAQGKDPKLSFWVSYKFDSGVYTDFQLSYNGGPFQTIDQYTGDSSNEPGNLNGYLRKDIDVSVGAGGNIQARWTYSGTFSTQESNPFILYYLMAWTDEAPRNTTVTISPSNPTTFDDLTVTYSADDPDGDNVEYTVEWYKNDVKVPDLTNQTTVDSNRTDMNDVWKCVVTPNDGLLEGESNYAQVQVGNAPPTMPDIDIIPHEPTTVDDLECVITKESTDPDGDAVSYIYTWKRNGMAVSGVVGARVDHNLTHKGESWTVVVKATDGNSTSAEAINTVFIANTPPMPPTGLDPKVTSDPSPRISWYGAYDIDGDALRYTLWVGTTNGSDDIVSDAFVGERDYYTLPSLSDGTYYVRIVCSDGMMDSREFLTDITINSGLNNSPPYPPTEIIPEETRALEVNITWYGAEDVDGDNLSYMVCIGDNDNRSSVVNNTAIEENHMTVTFPSYGLYYVTVRSFDGTYLSGPHTARVLIDPKADRPPTMPSALSPNYTNERSPNITWAPAMDPDGLPVTYIIGIGTGPYRDDVLSERNVGYVEYYRVPVTLSPGTYYVHLRSYDGTQYSPIYMAVLEIYNTPPTQPWNIKPDTTSVNPPRITWLPASDADGDTVGYYIAIGKSEGGSDIVPWTYVSTATYFAPTQPLPNGTLYVALKATDGMVNTTAHIETINISSGANIPPLVDRIRPERTRSSQPTISWLGWDPDGYGVNLTYRISIGTSPLATDVLDWTSTSFYRYYAYNGPPLSPSKYYVNVVASDGIEDSQILSSPMEVLTINTPPYPVDYIYPAFFHDLTPTIWWTPTTDPDQDNVSYIVKVGKSENGSEYMYAESESNVFAVTTPLPAEDVYVTVLATDNTTLSEVKSILVRYMEDGYDNLYPPPILHPTTVAPGEVEFWWEYYNQPVWYQHAKYHMVIGTAPYLNDIYTDLGPVDFPSLRVPYLPEGRFYVTLWAEVLSQDSYPAVFEVNVSSNAPPVPHTPYIKVEVIDGNVTATFTPEVGVDYYYALGTEEGKHDIINWTRTDASPIVIDGVELGLKDQEDYYLSVKAYKEGQISRPATYRFTYTVPEKGTGITLNDIMKKVYITVYPTEKTVTAQDVSFLVSIYNLFTTITVDVALDISANGTHEGSEIEAEVIDSALLSTLTIAIGGSNYTLGDGITLQPGAENHISANVTFHPTSQLPSGNYTITFTLRLPNGTIVTERNVTLNYVQGGGGGGGGSGGGNGGGGGDGEGGAGTVSLRDARVTGIVVLVVVIVIAGLVFYVLNSRGKEGKGGKKGRKDGGQRGAEGGGEEWIPVDEDELFEI